jgi:sec-independent protein translocase protein TatA
MPTSLGPAEILVILVVALIVLGPKKLPEAGRQIGKALAEVRRWSSSIQSEVRDVLEPEPEVTAPAVEAQPQPPAAVPPAASHAEPIGDGAVSAPPAELPPEWASPPPEPPSAGPSR